MTNMFLNLNHQAHRNLSVSYMVVIKNVAHTSVSETTLLCCSGYRGPASENFIPGNSRFLVEELPAVLE